MQAMPSSSPATGGVHVTVGFSATGVEHVDDLLLPQPFEHTACPRPSTAAMPVYHACGRRARQRKMAKDAAWARALAPAVLSGAHRQQRQDLGPWLGREPAPQVVAAVLGGEEG